MRSPRITRKRAVLAILVLSLAAVAIAAAAWLVSGSGNGRTQVASLTAPSVSSPAAWSGLANLFPGGTGDAIVQVTNPNPVALTIVTWDNLGGLGTFTPSNPATCPASNFTPVAGPASTVPTTIGANASNVIVTLKNAVALSSSAPSACQGQDVQVSGNPFRLNFSSP